MSDQQIPGQGEILTGKFDRLLALFSAQNKKFSNDIAEIKILLGGVSIATFNSINGGLTFLETMALDLQARIGGKEDTSNKTSVIANDPTSTTNYPSVAAVVNYVNSAMGTYVLNSALANYVTNAGLATALANLSSYVTNTGLATTLLGYVTDSSLAATLAGYSANSGFAFGQNETVTGTVPLLITTTLLPSGTYASVSAMLGCLLATDTATLQIYAGTTLLTTLTNTGTPSFVTTTGFTLSVATQLSFYLSGSSLTSNAFIYGAQVK